MTNFPGSITAAERNKKQSAHLPTFAGKMGNFKFARARFPNSRGAVEHAVRAKHVDGIKMAKIAHGDTKKRQICGAGLKVCGAGIKVHLDRHILKLFGAQFKPIQVRDDVDALAPEYEGGAQIPAGVHRDTRVVRSRYNIDKDEDFKVVAQLPTVEEEGPEVEDGEDQD
ncbi:hypothetical protein B0H11DRAFT_2389356 [Mycena galericulata]|nr:hypothetical protein B0H11DRAFT_2389356 [Mycena galericulata]